MGCVKSSGTIKIKTNDETMKSNELAQKKLIASYISSSECADSNSDISSNYSSLNNSPITKKNSFVINKNEESKKNTVI